MSDIQELYKHLNSYEFSSYLPSDNTEVTIKPLCTNGMKKLLMYENENDIIKGENVLDAVLKQCITSEIKVNDLLILDRYFLFLEIRKISKGSTFETNVSCENLDCKGQFVHIVDLDKLNVKMLDETKNKEIKVLDGKVVLTMGFFTRGAQKEGYALIKKNLSDKQKEIEVVLMNITLSVKKISSNTGEYELTLAEKFKFLGDLPEKEFDKINKWHEENEFGIDLKNDIKCPHCGFIKENEPISLSNFFL